MYRACMVFLLLVLTDWLVVATSWHLILIPLSYLFHTAHSMVLSTYHLFCFLFHSLFCWISVISSLQHILLQAISFGLCEPHIPPPPTPMSLCTSNHPCFLSPSPVPDLYIFLIIQIWAVMNVYLSRPFDVVNSLRPLSSLFPPFFHLYPNSFPLSGPSCGARPGTTQGSYWESLCNVHICSVHRVAYLGFNSTYNQNITMMTFSLSVQTYIHSTPKMIKPLKNTPILNLNMAVFFSKFHNSFLHGSPLQGPNLFTKCLERFTIT